MKFNKIQIKSNRTKEKGLKEINITRLSNVVALVGKNGSGKTRILDILEKYLFQDIDIESVYQGGLQGLPNYIQVDIESIAPYIMYWKVQKKIEDAKNSKDTSKADELYKEIEEDRKGELYNQYINDKASYYLQVNSIKYNISDIERNYLRRISYLEVKQLQESISDDVVTFEQLVDEVNDNTPYDEFKSIHKTGFKYLQKLPHQLVFDFMDCMGDEKKYEKRASFKRFFSLKGFIKDFLNKDLSWERKLSQSNLTEQGVNANFSGIWILEGREFNYKELSDGEKTLFSYALLFFIIDQNPKMAVKNCIILIDEPELHLHPSSEIDLINGLRNVVGESGQLIFTTHSINIVSHLKYDEIFMVKDGSIKHPSQATIGESISELMGIEDRISTLSDFLASLATWSFVNFMGECFDNPEVIATSKPNDPQVLAFKEALRIHSSKQSSLLLDFGAGKGRVYEHLKSDFSFFNKIKYCALEPDNSFHTNLQSLGAEKIYNSYKELPEKSFDFVLLCNVLHEIPINEWVGSLNGIIEALNKDGFLIILEAKVLTKGEKIGKEGFVLLDLEEIKVLFGLEDLPSSINIQGKEDIITCAVLSQNQLKPINVDDVIKTLEALESNSLEKIIKLRDTKTTSELKAVGIGRKNAFLSQLHINSRIAQFTLLKEKQKKEPRKKLFSQN